MELDDRTYQALRRNDATVTEVAQWFPFSSPVSLATALDGNTHVQTLDLRFGLADSSAPTHMEEHKRLRSYIKQAKSLRTVRYSFSGQGQILGEWIDAVAASANVNEIEVTSWSSFLRPHQSVATAVVGLLRTAPSIKSMKLRLFDCIGDVIERLRNNTTLESFSVDNASMESIQSILDALLGHCSISRVAFGMYNATENTEITPILVMEALFAMLGASSILTELSLGGFKFDDEGVEQLLNGLQCNQTMTKLALSHCHFSSAAEEAFVSYMQERNGCGGGHLHRLHIALCGTDGIEYMTNGNFPVRMLQGPRGSGLTSATFTYASFIGLWENHEDDTASQSRSLSHLRLDQLHSSNCEAAVRHIPNLLYLRTFEWYTNHQFFNYRSLLPAFRKNASLYSVVVRPDRATDEEVWNPSQERLLKAWGERNRHLPELLKQCGTKSSDEHSIGQEPEGEGGSSDGNGPPPSSFVGRSLSSKLFAVALQTPRMALHHCFHGITAMGDSLGCDRKSGIRLLPRDEATDK